MNKQKADLQNQINAKNRQIASLQAEGRRDDATIAALRRDVAALQSQIRQKDAQIASLRNEVASLEKKLAQANQTIQVQAGTIAEQKDTIQQKNGQISLLQSQRTQLQERVVDISRQLGQANADKAQLERELDTARAQIRDLTTQIDGLEEEVRVLRLQLETAQRELGDARDTISTLQTEQQALMTQYQGKIEELVAARTAIANLERANSDQLSVFMAIEQDLLADIERVRADYAAATQKIKDLTLELETARSEYDTLRATCPIIPDGTVVLDGGTGQLHVQENGRLRAMSPETWRARGSPAYTTYQSYMLENCPMGDPVMLDPTTPAPVTTTPAPGPSFDPTLYAIIHRDTYMASGKLHVLTTRFGSVTLAPYAQRDLAQVVLMSTDGRIRSASGSGAYLEHNDGCLLPALRDDPSEDGVWTVSSTGEAYANTLVSACGAALHANEDSTSVDLARQMDGSSWFIVPVGRASV